MKARSILSVILIFAITHNAYADYQNDLYQQQELANERQMIYQQQQMMDQEQQNIVNEEQRRQRGE